jgi:Zn ribbon nucleic-acid-binding protein
MKNRNFRPMTDYDKMKAWQPTAIDIRRAGKCSECKHDTLLFYNLPDNTNRQRMIADKSAVDGGFYCPRCGFGNAGAMYTEDYEAADILESE